MIIDYILLTNWSSVHQIESFMSQNCPTTTTTRATNAIERKTKVFLSKMRDDDYVLCACIIINIIMYYKYIYIYI